MEKERVEIRLPKSLKGELIKLAKQDGRSLSNYIEMALLKITKGDGKQ